MKKLLLTTAISLLLIVMCCSSDSDDPQPPNNPPPVEEEPEDISFIFGADLSYVNQILDRGGVYKDNSTTTDPYKIFADHGANLIRFRLWHNPTWTKEVYGEEGTQYYNDLADVERGIQAAKAKGLNVLLDFHYSDTWADPGKQYIPAAWTSITTIDDLEDSVYNYTHKVLTRLSSKNLLPEFVQLGNETNCGMLYSSKPGGFPALNVCDGAWANMGKAINAGIKAVRDVTANTTIKTKVILHVADPKNIDWWFTNIGTTGAVTDYDIIGFSYYPLWHTTVQLPAISTKISEFKTKFKKNVMILETAYPWTTEAKDSYNNAFGDATPISGYPFTKEGQYAFMKALTKEVKDGGGVGLIYWEPAWISTNMKDLWGTGSSWENATFFDFDGNVNTGIDYMNFEY